jgi:hypothetical protein
LAEYETLANSNNEEAADLAAVKEAARSLGLCVQVTRSQEKSLGVPEVMIASHHLLGQVLEQVSALKRQVASLEAQVNCGGGGDVGGSQKRVRAKGKGKEVTVEVTLDSDLSVSEVEEEGSQA